MSYPNDPFAPGYDYASYGTPPPPPPPPLNYGQGRYNVAPAQERTWAMLCHLSALLGLFVPFGAIIGPLIVWLIARNKSPYIDQQGRRSMDFHITAVIAMVVSGLLCFVLIGFVLLPLVILADVVLTVIATVRVSQGYGYYYPWSLRMLD